MSTSVLASMAVVLNGEISGFKKAMATAKKEMRDVVKVGESMKDVGKSLSMYVTAPLALMGGVAVAAWDKQAKAMAQVENGLRSTGGAAKLTMAELTKAASDLQSKTLFGDEEILQGATTQLLTFTNIAGEQFLRTQEAALDLATKLDGDLKSASIQLGKALNDPVANLSALSRSGIQFSEDQKKVINSLAKTGRLAEAQTIILDELEKQYGGTAAAAAAAGTGGLKQLQNTLGDILEEFGAIIYEGIKPLVEWLKNLAASFQGLSPEVKKVIVVVAAIVAALGPLLAIVGGILTALPALSAAFAVLTGPIGLTVAAVVAGVALIIKNWDTLKAYFSSGDGAGVFSKIKDVALKAFDAIKAVISRFVAWGKWFWGTFGGAIVNIGKVFFRNLQTVFSAGLDLLGHVLDVFRAAAEGNWSGLWQGMKNIAASVINGIISIVSNMALMLPRLLSGALKGLGIENSFTKGLEKGLENTRKLIDSIKLETKAVYENTQAKRENAAAGTATPSGGSATAPVLDTAPANGQLSKTQEILQRLRDDFNLATAQFAVFGDSFDVVGTKSKALESAINSLLENGIKPQSSLIQGLKAELDSLGNMDMELLPVPKIEEWRKSFEAVMTATSASVSSSVTSIAKSFEAIPVALKETSAEMRAFLEQQAKDALVYEEIIAGNFGGVGAAIDTLMDKMASAMERLQAQGAIIADFVTTAFSAVGQGLGDMFMGLSSGVDVLHNIGKSLLAAVADFAKKFGEKLVLIGIGENLLLPGSGLPKILAGAALIAAAGIGSALAGGKGAKASPSTGGSSYQAPRPNRDVLKGLNSTGDNTVRFRIEGKDLVAIQEKHSAFTKRFGG